MSYPMPMTNRRRGARLWPLLWLALLGGLTLVAGQKGEPISESEIWREALEHDLPGGGPNPIEVVETGDDYQVIRHVGGTTRTPFPPRRICALSNADELLSIGVMPVAHSIRDGNYPDYLSETLKDVAWIPNVYGETMPNLEAILRVQPDLIITRAPDRQTYLQLSKIAPVIVLLGHNRYFGQRVLDLGMIVGRRQQAEARVAWYEAKASAARAALHAKLQGRTFAFFRVNPRAFRLSGWSDSGGPVVFGDLDLPRPRLVRENRRNSSLSPEQLLDLDADYAVIAVSGSLGSERQLEALLEHPAWGRLPAAEAGHVLVLERYRHWADSGILGKSRIIDDVLRAITPESMAAIDAQAARALEGSGL